MSYRPTVPVTPGDPWSTQYRHESQSPVQSLEQSAECSVCGSGKSTLGNEILFCDGPDCDLPVHQKCYGVSEIPTGNWYCQRCEDRIPVYNTPNCCCLRTSGLFKRTTTPNKYIHVACARFNEYLDEDGETILFNPTKMSKSECAICRSSEGVCSPCSFPNCTHMMHVTCAQDHNLILKSMHPRLLCQQHRNRKKLSDSPSTDPGSWTSIEDHDLPLFPVSVSSTVHQRKKKRSRSQQDQRTPSVHGVDDSVASEFSRQCSVDTPERPESSRRHSDTLSRGRGTRHEDYRIQSSKHRGRTKDRNESGMDMDWRRESHSPRRRDRHDSRRRSSLQDKRAPRTISTGTLLQIQTFDAPKDSDSRCLVAKRRCSVQNVGPLSINSNGVSIVVHVQGIAETGNEKDQTQSRLSCSSRGTTTTTMTTTSTKTTTTQKTIEGNVSQKLKDLQRRYDALHDDYGKDKMRNLKMKENLREIFGAFKLPVPVSTTPAAAGPHLDNPGHHPRSTAQPRPEMMEWNPDKLEEYIQALRDVLVSEVTNDRSRPVPDPRRKPQLDVMFRQLLHQL